MLLARSSSGIYFLFSGATILTVAVSVLYMPETRGRDLEAIGEMFGLHRAADMPVVRGLRSLGSRIGRMVGIPGSASRGHVLSEVQDQGIELGVRR